MIKAVKPIAIALKLPKITLQAMFGKAEKPSMTYEELGKLTLREMLFFTIYHNLRHASQEGD